MRAAHVATLLAALLPLAAARALEAPATAALIIVDVQVRRAALLRAEACAVTPGGEPHSSTHAARDPNASLACDTHPTPQRCFLKGGALATCCHSEAVLLRRINRLAAARKWAAVVVTQDWHPPGHISFASAFPGAAPFSSVNLTYAPDGALLGVDGNATSAGANDTTISQVLWPEHCVANTSGASLAAGLAVPQGANVISLLKGRDSSIDDYRLAPAAGGDQ